MLMTFSLTALVVRPKKSICSLDCVTMVNILIVRLQLISHVWVVYPYASRSISYVYLNLMKMDILCGVGMDLIWDNVLK